MEGMMAQRVPVRRVSGSHIHGCAWWCPLVLALSTCADAGRVPGIGPVHPQTKQPTSHIAEGPVLTASAKMVEAGKLNALKKKKLLPMMCNPRVNRIYKGTTVSLFPWLFSQSTGNNWKRP